MAKKDRAFGVIVYRVEKEELAFLLICHHAGHWGFPKGHSESGESAEQAAFRELQEETGIAGVRPSWPICFSERYEFEKRERRVSKTVKYFLCRTASRRVRIQASELKDYRWVSPDEGARLITFDESRRILNEAVDYLRGKEENL